MRDFKGMKRQRGRNRGGGGGGKPQQNANRAFDSNGPDGVKVRGNAQHVFEKYQQLARDAGSAGDRVLAENYLQHAEHYFRLLRAIQPQRPAAEILGRDQFASGYDIDFEDESGQQAQNYADHQEAAAESQSQNDGERREWQNRDNRDRDNRDRDNRDRDNRDRDNRDRGQNNRDRGDNNRDGGGRRDRWRDRDRDGNRDRDDRPRADGDDRRDRVDRGSDRPERRDRDTTNESQEAPEPRGAVLRDAEGGESHAPAFLQARPEPREGGGEDEGGARRRRRRSPRSFEGGEPASGGGESDEG